MINIDESKQIYKPGEVDDAKASVIDAVNVDPSRMMALTDGIFGMVMDLINIQYWSSRYKLLQIT